MQSEMPAGRELCRAFRDFKAYLIIADFQSHGIGRVADHKGSLGSLSMAHDIAKSLLTHAIKGKFNRSIKS